LVCVGGYAAHTHQNSAPFPFYTEERKCSIYPTCVYSLLVIHFNRMINILVVTSDVPFGELIRQNLEEMGQFHVRVAEDKGSVYYHVREADILLAFLDTCIPEKELHEIGAQLLQANARMRFIVISEAGWHSALEEFSPEEHLSKPYSLPDLREMMDRLFPSPQLPDEAPLPVSHANEPPWLADVTRAAQHLTRLTLETSAQAALITRNDQLWAYAGQLSQSSTHELTETVSRYWDRQKENDLVRFVHLGSTGAEHMLYATRLNGDMVLALIFDAETPFSTIHTQASQLARSLSALPSERQADADQVEDEAPAIHISSILSDIPSPNPQVDQTRVAARRAVRESNPAIPLPFAAHQRFSRESSPAIPFDEMAPTQRSRFSVDDLDETIESAAVTRKNRVQPNQGILDDTGENRPGSGKEPARRIVLEPISPSVYNLDYDCLLIPRFPQHILIGDLSDRLSAWIQETCIAFGWRLEYISVRPDYLLWIVNVPPATSPGYLMRIARQRTSEKIFADFPRFKSENPSGDFWAPGYLLMGGSQPPPVQLIKEFIAQTRQRQGIPPQLR
jgi:REP element-mobilizing transposase RayT